MNRETVILNPRLAWREIEGRVVVISPEDSVVHELNETASFIWKHAERGRKASEIADLLIAEFRVDVAQANADTQSLLDVFSQKGLLAN